MLILCGKTISDKSCYCLTSFKTGTFPPIRLYLALIVEDLRAGRRIPMNSDSVKVRTRGRGPHLEHEVLDGSVCCVIIASYGCCVMPLLRRC